MKYKKFNNHYVIRLEKGEEIVSTLIAFLEKNNIKAGYFTGIGAITMAELRFFHQKNKQYYDEVFEGDFEVASMVGNISTLDGKAHIHPHGVISDKNMKCYGGHIKQAIVGPTIEISLIAFDGEIKRRFNPELGLNVMEF